MLTRMLMTNMLKHLAETLLERHSYADSCRDTLDKTLLERHS